MILTNGEKLYLYKKRHNGTLNGIAVNYCVGYGMAHLWMTDKRKMPNSLYKKVAPIKPTDCEELVLKRRRAGLKMKEVADMLGICHITVINIEKGLYTLSGDAYKLLINNAYDEYENN